MADYNEVMRKRRQALAQVANDMPRNTSFLPDGTPITDDELVDHIGNIPGVVPQGSAGDTTGREQFGLPPLPAPKAIGRAPGDGVPSVPLAEPHAAPAFTGYTPAPPPSFTPAAPAAGGGSGYGDAIAGLGAIGQSLWRMGQPGLVDRSGAIDPLANLPGQLQQRRLNDQRLAFNDASLQQQQSLQAQLPELQQQIASLPPALRTAAELAIRRGDSSALAGILKTAAAGRVGALGPNGEKAPSGFRFKADGTLEAIPGGPGAKDKALTEAQAKAKVYSDLMLPSHAIATEYEDAGTGIWTKAANGVPVLGNYAQTDAGRKFLQAQAVWAEQLLRFQTGAAATKDEIERTRFNYFPQPGDTADIVAQKRAAREQAQTAIAGIVPGYQPPEPAQRRSQPAQPAQSSAPTQGQPTRAEIEAEMRRRGLIK